MKRNSFYKVPVETFLFGKSSAEAAETQPEEAVRQWCAFELIRAYGFPVTDLEFEHPVKVGSKNYRIDIIAKRNGNPWIVVECKKPSFKKAPHAVDQAISYADSRSIQAEFVVYTNGFDWLVRRKVLGTWIEVPDIPARPLPEHPRLLLLEILDAIHDAAPLIHALDDRLSGKEAECFLSTMQEFFHGENLLTRAASRTLCSAADNLLRVISVRDDRPNDYQWQKLGNAYGDWCQYGKKIVEKYRPELPDHGSHFPAEMSRIRYELEDLIRDAPLIRSCDVLLLRLTISLLDYGETCFRKKTQFLEIPAQVHQTLREFLNFVLIVQLDTQLPDTVDINSSEKVKLYCSTAWTERLKSY